MMLSLLDAQQSRFVASQSSLCNCSAKSRLRCESVSVKSKAAASCERAGEG